MTLCVHGESFTDDWSRFFINDQLLTFGLVAQRDLTAQGVMLKSGLPQTTVDLLGEFGTVELCHTLKHGLKDDTFWVSADVLCGRDQLDTVPLEFVLEVRHVITGAGEPVQFVDDDGIKVMLL